MAQSSQARTSRSDEGILALANAVFHDIFGLTPETTSRMMKIIKNQGEWQAFKQSVRTMSGVAHRRLNDVVSMTQRNKIDGDEDEFDNEQELNDEMDGFDQERETDFAPREERSYGFAPREERSYENMTFVGYLLNELQYSDQDLRDPAKKQEIMRMMRAGDQQARQLIDRGEKDQKQTQRDEIQQETDPRKAGLRRKRLTLQRQIAQIDQQLAEPEQNNNTGFDTY